MSEPRHATSTRVATWSDQRQRYVTETGFRLYGCAKRGCDEVNPDYEATSGYDHKTYCLNHLPFRDRFWLWRHRNAY